MQRLARLGRVFGKAVDVAAVAGRNQLIRGKIPETESCARAVAKSRVASAQVGVGWSALVGVACWRWRRLRARDAPAVNSTKICSNLNRSTALVDSIVGAALLFVAGFFDSVRDHWILSGTLANASRCDSESAASPLISGRYLSIASTTPPVPSDSLCSTNVCRVDESCRKKFCDSSSPKRRVVRRTEPRQSVDGQRAPSSQKAHFRRLVDVFEDRLERDQRSRLHACAVDIASKRSRAHGEPTSERPAAQPAVECSRSESASCWRRAANRQATKKSFSSGLFYLLFVILLIEKNRKMRNLHSPKQRAFVACLCLNIFFVVNGMVPPVNRSTTRALTFTHRTHMSDAPNLALIAENTVTALSVIWQELGKDKPAQQRAIRKLCDDVATVYDRLLREEEEKRDTCKRQIVAFVADIAKVAAQLVESADNVRRPSVVVVARAV